MKKFENLSCTTPKRELMPAVYDNYRSAQDYMKNLFKNSIVDFSEYEYLIEEFAAIRRQVPKEIYKGLTVCGLPVEEVGCGIICTMQAMTAMTDDFSRRDMEEIVSIVEKNGYYYPGRGLYWHWFNNWTRRATHWYELITAIKCGNPVTVLIRRPGDTRNYFLNLIGLDVKKGEKAKTPSDVIFITSDESNYFKITLETLMDQIVTAPWIWC